jgi:enoyl-CoA hydratase/carnithine racemase
MTGLEEEVLTWREGVVGRVRLNRPGALNALNHNMVKLIRAALAEWQDSPEIMAIIMDGAGDKAFCAGGDIRFMYETGRSDPEPGRQFWRDEYSLNLAIARYPKPIVAIMDGITMGGGVGLASHASHRIVTEKALIAMPEAAIGFLPDVGGTHILAQAPGKTGLYLATTSARMGAADAIFAGFADAFVPTQSIPAFIQALASGQPPLIALAGFSSAAPEGVLSSQQNKINMAFGAPTMLDCVLNIEKAAESGDEWAVKTATALRHNSPFSLAACFSALAKAEHLDLEECLRLEYRFSHRVLSHADYYEGVRAVIIDKDRDPKWSPSRLEDVDLDAVEAMLSPLGENDWHPQ